MTHPAPEELLRLALHEIPKEKRGSVLAHVMSCCNCQALSVKLTTLYHLTMREAIIFSKLLGRLVTPSEIMEGRRHN